MNLRNNLEKFIAPDRIKDRLIDVTAYASDAGFYHLTPKAVVLPISEKEIQDLFQLCNDIKMPMTFRCGGTSLSGQAISDGILVDLGKHWRSVKPEMEGTQVRTQPGVIGSWVNLSLKKYGMKMGPDPSSINSAMMGGILSNNSSGMCCGVSQNSYHTLKYIKIILPNGNVFSTEKPEDYNLFLEQCPAVAECLMGLRLEVLSNEPLLNKIRSKYQLKNTVGYGLNSLIDYEHPLDILAHLMIGAEGTLGFIAEAVMETVADLPFKSTGLLYFETIHAACSAILPLIDSKADALELMDRPALRSIEMIKGVSDELKNLPEGAAALLCEYQAHTQEELEIKLLHASKYFSELTLLHVPSFTTDAYQQYFLWKLRKGMFPSVGAVRKQGTTVLLEDIAFPLDRLADAVVDTQLLFDKHGYDNGIIFGHAKDGNIHFVVSQSFNTPTEIARYQHFMDDVVQLVVHKYHGTLKAEHGTGRNMAPFVETEWGGDAYAIMKKIKEVLDPNGILNPGVIINEDRLAHLKNLKSMPIVEAEVDKCIECGYCERSCPSRDYTLTPRQRIVVRRALATMKSKSDTVNYKKLVAEYQFDGLDTCAVDGMCATDCPVDINTGDLVKRLRKENHSPTANKIALLISKHFYTVESLVKFAIRFGTAVNSVFGKNTMTNFTLLIKKIIPPFPLWSLHLTAPAKLPKTSNTNADVVYLPTCISRAMGASEYGKKNIIDTFLSVASKAGQKVKIADKVQGHCCGQVFSSKGFNPAAELMMNKTVAAAWEWTEQGKLPLVLDVSSCTYTLLQANKFLTAENQIRLSKIKILDSVDYLADQLLPLLNVAAPKENVVFHPVCSLTKLGNLTKLKTIGKACSTQFTMPDFANCCGMAGDRGFLYPKLTASAVAHESIEVKQVLYDGYYSSAKTCEIALSDGVGKNYESILYLVDEVTV